MDEKLMEDIYGTLCGLYIPQAMVPGVPDLFVDGSFCMTEYIRMRRAYERICLRLGVDPEDGDGDMEELLEALDNIQKTVGAEMFRQGNRYRK